ncbi:sensor histidine kinase [Micromonospora pattaloongensis]|uniref:sensor histidine kinase n=1 Tax=Micromonospora pattaloongensis TaxID=405436 RepID=UPI001587D84B|nr:HAMP domain-containing sensor histidine kinase [Micromonospora pattaloongensis]
MAAGFAAGALVLSAGMALVSYGLTRTSLLEERERTAIRAAYFNATIVNAGISGDQPDVLEVLRSLDTGTNRRPVLRRDARWYARSADSGITDAIPQALRQLVEQGRPAVQRIRAGDGPAIVVGVPLAGGTAFYQVDSLTELDRTVQTLALVLIAVAAMTTGAGAALGWYTTRRVLRPLALVADAAHDIARGDLTARLDPAADPDLTRLTGSFNHMVDELARRLERDRRFAADVAHELRSPLQTLAAAGSVLTRRRAALDDRTATAADLVAVEIQRFQTLVNDLLELARSDQPARREPVDIAALARQVCRSRGLPDDIVEVAEGAAVTWHVDRRRVRQLLGNLVDNAVDHGGGPVAVRIGGAGVTGQLDVDDEGPGVSPEDKDVIFDRFVRGRAAAARGSSDGTGLGLALVAQHVAAHQGRVAVLDRPGGGARFRVELPGCLR